MSINLNQQEKSVIIGSLLGDGYIDKHNSLQIEHSLQQKEYVYWKYEMLKSIAGKTPKEVTRVDSRNGRTYRSIRFYTRCVMENFRNLFYSKGKRKVPDNLGKLLDDLALAVWFMDDGGRGANTIHGVVFNTSNFCETDQYFLQQVLFDNFRIKANIHHVGKGYQLYVRAKSYKIFYDCIRPYVIPTMKYKLVDPVTTDFRICGMR